MTQHSKDVTFSPPKTRPGENHTWIRVYFDGLHVGNIDCLDDGHEVQRWSANKHLNDRYGHGFCEDLPLDEAKRIVERAILCEMGINPSESLAESLMKLNDLVEHLESLRSLRRTLAAKEAHRKDMKDE